jgi:hypothetical protein
MDTTDKATNKAMSAAYKYAALLTFAIPTEGDNDADTHTHVVMPRSAPLDDAIPDRVWNAKPNGTDELRNEVDDAVSQATKTLTMQGIERGEQFVKPLLKKLDRAGRSDLKEMLVSSLAASRARVSLTAKEDAEMALPE